MMNTDFVKLNRVFKVWLYLLSVIAVVLIGSNIVYAGDVEGHMRISAGRLCLQNQGGPLAWFGLQDGIL